MDISLIGDMFSIKHSVDYHVEEEDYHVHGDYEILFPVFGSVSFCAESHHYNLQPGMIMVIPPGVRHRYDKKNKKVMQAALHFGADRDTALAGSGDGR